MNYVSFIKGMGSISHVFLLKLHRLGKVFKLAKVLEAKGIACNLTLLFGLHQAQACADAKVTLISPL